jgi:hypothetical protein
LPPSRPKVDLVALAKRSLALREQHTNPRGSRDGFGRSIKAVPATVVRYSVEFEDGTALSAAGEHADVIYRYIQECERLCGVHGFVFYEGPGMETLTRAQLLDRMKG